MIDEEKLIKQLEKLKNRCWSKAKKDNDICMARKALIICQIIGIIRNQEMYLLGCITELLCPYRKEMGEIGYCTKEEGSCEYQLLETDIDKKTGRDNELKWEEVNPCQADWLKQWNLTVYYKMHEVGSVVLDKNEKYYAVIDGSTEFIDASNLDDAKEKFYEMLDTFFESEIDYYTELQKMLEELI